MHALATAAWHLLLLTKISIPVQVPITRIEKFGAIVAFTSTKDGLCHKSELDLDQNADPLKFSEGQLIDVQLLDVRSPAIPAHCAMCCLFLVTCSASRVALAVLCLLYACMSSKCPPGVQCTLGPAMPPHAGLHALLLLRSAWSAGHRGALQAVQESPAAARGRSETSRAGEDAPAGACSWRGRQVNHKPQHRHTAEA